MLKSQWHSKLSLAGVKPGVNSSPIVFSHSTSLPSFGRFQRAQLSRRLPLLFTNPYVFPPIVLMPDHEILPFITCLGFSCTLVFQYPRPRKVWWSVHAPFEGYFLAPKGAKGVKRRCSDPHSCRIFRNVAFALGFVGCFSSLAVFIPSPSPQKRK